MGTVVTTCCHRSTPTPKNRHLKTNLSYFSRLLQEDTANQYVDVSILLIYLFIIILPNPLLGIQSGGRKCDPAKLDYKDLQSNIDF